MHGKPRLLVPTRLSKKQRTAGHDQPIATCEAGVKTNPLQCRNCTAIWHELKSGISHVLEQNRTHPTCCALPAPPGRSNVQRPKWFTAARVALSVRSLDLSL